MRVLSILFLVGLIGIVSASQDEEIRVFMRQDLANNLLGVGPVQTQQASFPSSTTELNGEEEISYLSTDLGIQLKPYIDALGTLTRV